MKKILLCFWLLIIISPLSFCINPSSLRVDFKGNLIDEEGVCYNAADIETLSQWGFDKDEYLHNATVIRRTDIPLVASAIVLGTGIINIMPDSSTVERRTFFTITGITAIAMSTASLVVRKIHINRIKRSISSLSPELSLFTGNDGLGVKLVF